MQEREIRPAREDEVGLVMGFILALARYEKMEDQVVVTEEELRGQLFGKHPAAEAVLVFEAEKAVGLALFFHNFSTFEGRRGLYLEDLFVDPAHRGKGHGKALLQYLAKLAVERGCARFEWSVLDWNTPSIAFYESQGARILQDWRTCRVDGEALHKLAEAD